MDSGLSVRVTSVPFMVKKTFGDLNLPYKHVKIAGIGSYLPERIVTNDELSKTLDTSDEWIFSHTGIRQRHIADDSQAPVDMAYEASRKALAEARLEPDELGMILLSTVREITTIYPPQPACCNIASGQIMRRLSTCWQLVPASSIRWKWPGAGQPVTRNRF